MANEPQIPKVVCDSQGQVVSPSRNPGYNLGGLGWIPSYCGLSGTVPVGADPVSGESLTGKFKLQVWAEVTHVDY